MRRAYPESDPEVEDTRRTFGEQVRADRRGRTAPTGNGNRAVEGAERAEDPGSTHEPVGEEGGSKGVREASENTAGGPPARKRTRIAPPAPASTIGPPSPPASLNEDRLKRWT